MIAQVATPGVLVCDSLQFSQSGTAKQAQDLAAEGVACFVGYLGAINRDRIGYLHDAGIAFMPVTFGTKPQLYNGTVAASACKALELPEGVSVWLDLEGMAAWKTPDAQLMALARAWAQPVKDAGYMPCLYVGVPEPLTSDELYSLPHVRYWHGQGNIVDHAGHAAAPVCGWTMRQKWPSLTRGGVLVDDNTITPDILGRLPVWAAPDTSG